MCIKHGGFMTFPITNKSVISIDNVNDYVPELQKLNQIPVDLIKKSIPDDVIKNFPDITSKIIKEIHKKNISKTEEDDKNKDEAEIKKEKTVKLLHLLQSTIDSLSRVKFYKSETGRLHFSPISSLFNQATVLRGAWKEWDPVRMLSGKHAVLAKIGAEHVMVQNSLKDVIDITYVSVKKFALALKKLGAEKCLFQPVILTLDLNRWQGAHVNILLPKGNIKALKIEYKVLLAGADYDVIEKFYKNLGLKVYQDSAEGDVYVISDADENALTSSPYYVPVDPMYPNAKELSAPRSELLNEQSETVFSFLDHLSKPFMGYYFEKYSPEVEKILNNLEIVKSPWSYINSGGHGYIVRKEDLGAIKAINTASIPGETLKRYDVAPVEPLETGTVLLAMNQMEVYEMFCHEFLTFLFEDMNVMAYNNAGKGLSSGGAAEKNIKEAAECSYQYLHNIKKIPDNKILAKGQCFGGAPTAWLGAKHPNINLMIDQAPANFNDVATNTVKKAISKKIDAEKDHDSLKYKFLKTMQNSTVIDDLTKAVMIGFDAASDIKKNQGHNLIHINVPNEFGQGGDTLVPESHPEKMVDSFALNKGRIYALSFNPGGIHVTNWFGNPSSRNAVFAFLNKTNLAPNVSKNDRTLKRIMKNREVFETDFESLIKKVELELEVLKEQKLKGKFIQFKEIQPLVKACADLKQEFMQALSQVEISVNTDIKGVPQGTSDRLSTLFKTVWILPVKDRLKKIDELIHSLEETLIPIAPPLPISKTSSPALAKTSKAKVRNALPKVAKQGYVKKQTQKKI